MQQFCNSCDEYRDVVIDSDCSYCVWHKAVAITEGRIIKSLEERLQLLDQMFIDEPTPYTNGFASAIAFIKGEQK